MKAYYWREEDEKQAAFTSYLWVSIPENQVAAFEAALAVVWPSLRLALGQAWAVERFTISGTVAPPTRQWTEGLCERWWGPFGDSPKDKPSRTQKKTFTRNN